MPAIQASDPTQDEIAVAQAVFQHWQGGNQQAAVDALRPLVDDDRPWSLALMTWLLMQRGVPLAAEGVPYAKRAAELGMPWAALHLFNNLLANVQSDPSFLDAAIDLATSTEPWWSAIDPVGQGWNLIAQGRPADGVRLMGIRGTNLATSEGWDALAAVARQRMVEIESVVKTASDSKSEVANAVATGIAAIDKAKTDIETSAKQAKLLVSAVVSDSAASLFDKDAKRNGTQSFIAWVAGLVVLVTAAGVAAAPLVLHYAHAGPEYSTGALLGVHAAATAAFATVAGVLLARGRTRDLARQRANDMSTAMGTMIAYSNQIEDPGEKQRFMTTMGQLVLQAHLTSGGGHSGDESATGLIALANLMRSSGSGPAS